MPGINIDVTKAPYSADPTGAADSTAAIQAAANAAGACSDGGELFFPAGTYKVANSTPIILPPTTALSGKVNIRGSGSACTRIVKASVLAEPVPPTPPVSPPAPPPSGGTPPAVAGSTVPMFVINGNTYNARLHTRYSGITLVGDGDGVAFQIQKAAYLQFDDVVTLGFNLHWDLTDVLTSRWAGVRSEIGHFGMWARQGISGGYSSKPNKLTVEGCTFGSLDQVAILTDYGSGLVVVGGNIEGSGGTGWACAVVLNHPGPNGGVAAEFDGVHFENNAGVADVLVIANQPDAGSFPATVSVRGSIFNRISSVRATTHNVYVIQNAGDGPVRIDARGAGFNGYTGIFGSYTPDSSRRYINIEDTQGDTQVLTTGASYASQLEVPLANKRSISPATGMSSSASPAAPTSHLNDDGDVGLAGTLRAAASILAGSPIGTLSTKHIAGRNLGPFPVGISGVGTSYLSINSGVLSIGVALSPGNAVNLDGIRFKLNN